MSRIHAEWVICCPPHDGLCLRCGQTLSVPTPISVREYCAIVNAFVAQHASCSEASNAEAFSEATA